MALRRERMRLGDLLIKQNVLTEEQLKKALQLQKGSDKKIGEILVENGFITEEMIARALQMQLGLKVVQLTGVTIPKEVRNLVSVDLMKKYTCIPFELDPYNANILHLAMADPMDMAAIDDISIVTTFRWSLILPPPEIFWLPLTAITVRQRLWMLPDVSPRRGHSCEAILRKMKQMRMSAMHRLYSWSVP